MSSTTPAAQAADHVRIRRLALVGGAVALTIFVVAGLVGYLVFYTHLFSYQPTGRLCRPTVPLAFSRPGRLRELLVVEGQEVKKGQRIAKLSDATLQGEIALAEATLAHTEAERAARAEDLRMREYEVQRAYGDKYMDLQIDEDSRQVDIREATARIDRLRILLAGAKKQYDRIQMLYDEGSISERELDDARTLYESYEREINGTQLAIEQRERSVKNAASRREGWEESRFKLNSDLIRGPYDAMVAEARVRLNNLRDEVRSTELVAPEDGVVVRVGPEPHQVLAAGQPVGMLLTNRPEYVETYVEEYYLERYPLGGAVWLETMETEIEFSGTIVYLGPEMVEIPDTLKAAAGGYSRFGRLVRIEVRDWPDGVSRLPGLPFLVTSKLRWLLDY